MQIFLSESAGFCEGVSKAYDIANNCKNCYMLGNLVHNKEVVAKLSKNNIKSVESIDAIPSDSTVIISAHGVPPEVIQSARAKGLKIIDTTCSWVKRAQKLAKEAVERGSQLIIVGDKKHPEVIGIKGWSQNKGIVVSSCKEIEDLGVEDNVAIVAQTTQSEDNFDSIVGVLKKKVLNLLVHKTICGATQKRQRAAIELAKKVNVMLVIGDRMSANTNRLTELCLQTGTPTHQIQTKDELKTEFLSKKEKVGITAGASTPDWVIKEICDIIST